MISKKSPEIVNTSGVQPKNGGYPILLKTGPDLTEGRHGPRTKHYIVVYTHYASHEQSANFVEVYAHLKHGPSYAFGMGVFGGNSIIRNWSVHKITWDRMPQKADFILYDRFTDVPIEDQYPHEEVINEQTIKNLR